MNIFGLFTDYILGLLAGYLNWVLDFLGFHIEQAYVRMGEINVKLLSYFMISAAIAYACSKGRHLPALAVNTEKLEGASGDLYKEPPKRVYSDHDLDGPMFGMAVFRIFVTAVIFHGLMLLWVSVDLVASIGNIKDSINACLATMSIFLPLYITSDRVYNISAFTLENKDYFSKKDCRNARLVRVCAMLMDVPALGYWASTLVYFHGLTWGEFIWPAVSTATFLAVIIYVVIQIYVLISIRKDRKLFETMRQSPGFSWGGTDETILESSELETGG